MEEIWVDVIGYESMYQISNTGKFKSLDRVYRNQKIKHGFADIYRKGKTIAIHKVNGYEYVQLTKNGKQKHVQLHRLLAVHFIENPNNFPCVNHIDENRSNNNLENLEWCTYQHNTLHGTNIDRQKATKIERKIGDKYKKYILQYDLNMNLIKEWFGLGVTAKANNISRQRLYNAIKRNSLTMGFYWKYK